MAASTMTCSLLLLSMVLFTATDAAYHAPSAPRRTIPEGGSCRASGSVCSAGLICFGRGSSKRCTRPAGLNDICRGRGVAAVCDEGLQCIGSRCTKIAGERESCLEDGIVCAFGLECAGNSMRKRCVVPRKFGESCGRDPFWVCEEGTECIGRICQRPALAEGESCFDDGPVCDVGLICAGPGRSSRCVRRVGLNGRCRGPVNICQIGLDCIGGKCTKIVGRGDSCIEDGVICESNLVCAGTESRKICVVPKPIGGRCGQDPFWVCAPGVACVHGVCKAH